MLTEPSRQEQAVIKHLMISFLWYFPEAEPSRQEQAVVKLSVSIFQSQANFVKQPLTIIVSS